MKYYLRRSLALTVFLGLMPNCNAQSSIVKLLPGTGKSSKPVGHLTFQVQIKKDGVWQVFDSERTVTFGDCEGCTKGINLGYVLLNGSASDLKSLGSAGISLQFEGETLDDTVLNIHASGSLVRNEQMADVGCSLDGSTIPVKAGKSLEVKYIVESPNPFDTEPVDPSAHMEPTAYKIIASINS